MAAANTLVRSQEYSTRHGPASFVQVASMWFLGLAGLYVLYMCSAFLGPERSLSVQDRLLMAFGPTTVTFAFLISPAVFAAALERFHPFRSDTPAGRGAHWGHLALFGLAASALAAVGPHVVEAFVTPAALRQTPEDALVAYEALAIGRLLLLPLAMGLLALCSGIVGGLVGQATARWRPRRRDAARWLMCLALIASFLFPFLVVINVIRLYQAPAYWIIVGPLVVPLFFVGTLMWRIRATSGLRLARRQDLSTMDPETVDRIVSAVNATGEHPERDPQGLATTGFELEMVRLAAGIRREIAMRTTISESRVQEIVTEMLRVSPARASRFSVSTSAVPEPGRAGVFVTSWGCLAAGLMIVSPLGSVPPSFLSAIGAGLLGSIAVVFIARRYPSLKDTVPI